MRCKRAVPLILVAALAGSALQGAIVAEQTTETLSRGNQEKAARRLKRESGKPIDIQLRPADKEVEVIDFGSDPPLKVVDESGNALESMTRAFDLVALVQVVGVNSELIRDRSWIESVVEADILEILKTSLDAPRRYAKGDRLTFRREGGTVSIDQKTVTARISWARNLERGQTYLVFGWHPKGELDIPLDAAYQVVGQRLRSVSTGKTGRDDIENDTLNAIRGRVKRAIGVK